LIRTGDIDETTNVPLTFNDVNATRYVDYSFDSGYVTFFPGETKQTITLTAKNQYDDLTAETSESFVIGFGNIENGVADENSSQCTVTINDNELPVNKVEIEMAEYVVDEDDQNAYVVVKHISNSTQGGFSVDYRFSNNTATNGTDYTGIGGTLVFAPGETEKLITIPILDDGTYEGDFEYFTVYLRDSKNNNGVVIGDRLSCSVKINEVTSNIILPVLEVVDDNTQWPSLRVSNILGGGRLRVYRYNDATDSYEFIPTLYVGSYPFDTDSWNISINTSGTYVVTRVDAQELESNFSNAVTVTVKSNQIIRPPMLNAQIVIDEGSLPGTIKVTISGLDLKKKYYYGVGSLNMQYVLVENNTYGSNSMNFPNEIPAETNIVIDNITAQSGQFFNIVELTQGEATVIYGYTITACTSVYID